MARLQTHVNQLSVQIGERNFKHYSSLLRAAGYIRQCFLEYGYEVSSQDYQVDGETFSNLSVELRGTGREPIVVGAHYDSFLGSPGANDNASALAVLLELSRRLRGTKPLCTVKFACFVNEEPPFFLSSDMGSYVFAKELSETGAQVRSMVCLDTVGCYSLEKESQKKRFGRMPAEADFVAFVGPGRASKLIDESAAAFAHAQPNFPLFTFSDESGAISEVNYSDHWSFHTFGWPAFMVTDTGPLRSPHYHTSEDSIEKLDFGRMQDLTDGLEHVLPTIGEA